MVLTDAGLQHGLVVADAKFWDRPLVQALKVGNVQKVFRREIPIRERNEWDGWLAGQRAEDARLTAETVVLETELNDRVDRLFDLTPEEIRLIEETA